MYKVGLLVECKTIYCNVERTLVIYVPCAFLFSIEFLVERKTLYFVDALTDKWPKPRPLFRDQVDLDHLQRLK